MNNTHNKDQEQLKSEYEKTINKELSKYDVNPFIINDELKILLQKRISTVQFGGMWIMPGGKVFLYERIVESLKRMTLLKTNANIDLFKDTLNESLVGVYDDPYRDPREHVVGLTFVCKYINGKLTPGGNSAAVDFFSIDEALSLELGFGHGEMIMDGARKFLNYKK